MAKKLFVMAIVSIFICSTLGICNAESTTSQPTVPPVEKTKDRLSRGMNNLLYGSLEVPSNIDETKTKGTQMDRCSTKTRSGVERGIARIFAGVWQLATFWYSDPGCVTSASEASK
ncbi:MAG: hypothetical protein WC515_08480 [Candidatus Omnitrophota bacterium]